MAHWVGNIWIFSIIKDLEILKFCDILCLMHEIFRIDPDIRSDFEKNLNNSTFARELRKSKSKEK